MDLGDFGKPMPKYTDANNPYLKRLEDLAIARKRWIESEWVLNFLRTTTGQLQRQFNDEELLSWYQNSKKL